MNLGLRISKLIKENGINVNELALKAGVPPATIYSLIRRSSSRTNINLVIKIARALGVTVDELLDVKEGPTILQNSMRNPMDKYKDLISKNIRKYRLLAGLSQTTLAEKLSVSPAAVSNWEKGKNSIDIDTLFKLCEILGVSVNAMGNMFSEGIALSEEETKVILAYRSLGNEQQDLICRMFGIEKHDSLGNVKW